MLPFLDEHEVRKHLQWDALIAAMEDALIEFSAGGVVVRQGAGGPECIVIVPTRRAAGGAKVLTLPKGHPDEGETPEQAALREVREETGVEAHVVGFLDDVRYFYQRDGRRISKVVSFFLLEHVAGDPESHVDDEIDTAGSISQAAQLCLDVGATEVYASAIHPVLSGEAVTRLKESALREIVVTNSIWVPAAKRFDKLTILSIGPLLGETIQRIHTGASVSATYRTQESLVPL